MYSDISNRSNGDIGVIYNNSNLSGVYQHNGTNFSLVNSGLNAVQEQVWGNSFYGASGVQTGTLNQTTNLNLAQLRNRVNLYSNLSYLSFNNNTTDMSSMFFRNSTIINIPNFDTSNVTNMSHTFFQCTKLTNISNFDTSNVTNMSNLFETCSNLINVPEFDTSKVTNMSYMFSNCINLVNVPEFNTSKVASYRYSNIANMFYRCNNLSNASIQNIVNMCINSGIESLNFKNLSNANLSSPLYNTIFDSSYYSNRLSDLTNAGWTY